MCVAHVCICAAYMCMHVCMCVCACVHECASMHVQKCVVIQDSYIHLIDSHVGTNLSSDSRGIAGGLHPTTVTLQEQ